MCRKGKNTHNTTKSNTTPVKSSDPTTARLEKPNRDDVEENNLKITSGECLRPLKRKWEIPSKNEEKANKQLEDINKSLKENQEKAIKHM